MLLGLGLGKGQVSVRVSLTITPNLTLTLMTRQIELQVTNPKPTSHTRIYNRIKKNIKFHRIPDDASK